MRIGIDARLWDQTGVGTYIKHLVNYIDSHDLPHEFVVFLPQKYFETITFSHKNISKHCCNIRWHSFSEQLLLPIILRNERLDIVHFPYFSVPVFLFMPFIVTIHDLIINHHPTGLASTKHPIIYYLKRIAYKFIFNHAIASAQKIITVSNTVKLQLIKENKIPDNKIIVTYESGELPVTNLLVKTPEKYFLYVGNAYPHKNLEFLLNAFDRFQKYNSHIKLVCIGPDDFFYGRFTEIIQKKNLKDSVIINHRIKTSELSFWYKNAIALILPSKEEGFGLPGIEAQMNHCPVLASDIPVFREIYSVGARYFDLQNIDSLIEQMKKLSSEKQIREELIVAGGENASKFSWDLMGEETIGVYENSVGL